jgi:hypothetical protein
MTTPKPKPPHPHPPPHAPVVEKTTATLAAHPGIVAAAVPPAPSKGAPFMANAETLAARAGKSWPTLVTALGRERNLSEPEIRRAFVETAHRHAGGKPTPQMLKGTFNEIVLGHAPERCAARTRIVEAALFLQIFDLVAGRKSFFINDGLTAGGFNAVPLSAGRVLTLADLKLPPAERAAAAKRMKSRPAGPPSPALYDFVLAETYRLHAVLKDQVVHVRDTEIDGSEFIDRGSVLPLTGDRHLLNASEEFKTVGSGGGAAQSAVKLSRMYGPGISGATPLTLPVTNNLSLSAWPSGPPGGEGRIDTTMGRLVVPMTADGANQVLVKATKGPVDRSFVRDVLRGKGLSDRMTRQGNPTVADGKLETVIHVELLRMPGRAIEDVFEALIRNPYP